MKRLGIILMSVFCLLGCQKEIKVEKLEQFKSYTLQEKLDFELIKTEVVEFIEPSNKNHTFQYLKPENKTHQFIDVILKTTSLIDEQELQKLYQGHMKVNKQTYEIQTVMESVDYNQLSTTDTLKQYETRYVHLYCEVPKNDVKGTVEIEFTVLSENKYKYTFTPEETIAQHNEKSLGDVLSLEKSQIVMNTLEQSDKVEPSNKGFFYGYIPVENENEIFLIFQIDLKNISEKTLNPSQYIYCEYNCDGEESQAMIIIENDNHQSLSKSGVVKPQETRTIYLAMPIQKENANKDGMVEFFVEGTTYKIAYRHE